MPNVSNEKYLELAKLDFNRLQALYRQELQDIQRCCLLHIYISLILNLSSLPKANNIFCTVQRWWDSLGFSELGFTHRERVVEIYFSAASFLFEPEFATCRAVYTKTAIFTVILDDLYDAHGTLENVNLFTESVKR